MIKMWFTIIDIIFILYCVNIVINIIFTTRKTTINLNNSVMDAIITFLVERWPLFAIVLISVVVTVIICKWYFNRFVPTEKNVVSNQKRIDELPCAKHEEEISSIRAYLLVKYPKAFGSYAQKKSPRCLNEEGEKLFEEIGGAGFLATNAAKLMAKMEQKKPKTPLDVEFFALDTLYGMLSDDMFNDIKRWVYDSPMRRLTIDGVEKDYEVTMGDVCFVLSIPLRDLYLEMHSI